MINFRTNTIEKMIMVTLFIPVFLCGMEGHSFGNEVTVSSKKMDMEISKLREEKKKLDVVILDLNTSESTAKLNLIRTSSDVLDKESELAQALETVAASDGQSKSVIKKAKKKAKKAKIELKKANKKKEKAIKIALKKSKLLQRAIERQVILAAKLSELRPQTGLSDGVFKESPAPVIHINLDNLVKIKKDRVKKGISGRVENVKKMFINDTAVFVRPDNKFYIVMPLPLADRFEFNFKAIGTNGKEVTDTITFVRQ